MTTPRTRIELRRGSDLAIIMSAIEGACPAVPADAIGLADIAELCRRHGVIPELSFMVGPPDDTEAEAHRAAAVPADRLVSERPKRRP